MLQLTSAKVMVAAVMAAVRALPILSMDAISHAARLALPQVGCSNPRWALPVGMCFRCQDIANLQFHSKYFVGSIH